MAERMPLHTRMRRFPLADERSWEPTSAASDEYNCAAWAAGVTNSNWWPEPDAPEYYWPPHTVRDGSLQAFQAGYAAIGFEVCEDDSLEPGFEKIVIDASTLGSPKHVARQLVDGRWTSKLGDEEDISHLRPQDLAGSIYGNPVAVLRRTRDPS